MKIMAERVRENEEMLKGEEIGNSDWKRNEARFSKGVNKAREENPYLSCEDIN